MTEIIVLGAGIGGVSMAYELRAVTGANFRAEGESEAEKCDSSYE